MLVWASTVHIWFSISLYSIYNIIKYDLSILVLILFVIYEGLPLDLFGVIFQQELQTLFIFDNKWDLTAPDLTGSQVTERNWDENSYLDLRAQVHIRGSES